MNAVFDHVMAPVTRFDDSLAVRVAQHSRNECLKMLTPLFGRSEGEAARVLGTYFQAPLRAAAYAAPLLAEPFDVRESGRLIAVTVATQCFDYFAHCVDDVADLPARDHVASLHAASYALSQGVSGIARLSSADDRVMEAVHRFLLEASQAERRAMEWGRCLTEVAIDDLRIFGKKSSYLKIPIFAYAHHTDKWSVVPMLEDAVDWVCTGVQLVDDLTDWLEDFNGSHFTLPIKLAFRHCGIATEEHIESGIYSVPVTITVLQSAVDALVRGRNILVASEASGMASLVGELLNALSLLSALMKRDWSTFEPTEIRDRVRKYLQHDLDPRLGH